MRTYGVSSRNEKRIKRPFSVALPIVCVFALGVLLLCDPLLPAHAAVSPVSHSAPLVSKSPAQAVVPAKVAPRPTVPLPVGGVPALSGQLILVSESQQWLWVYQDRQLVYATPITTGRPDLRHQPASFMF